MLKTPAGATVEFSASYANWASVGSLGKTVKNILVEHGIDPGPQRGKDSWSEFLKIHGETLWQVDFFSERIWTAQGSRQTFSMVLLHVASRRVFATDATFKPDAVWMKSQARAFLRHVEESGLTCNTLVRDRDGKYSADFDRCFTDRSIRVKPVGPQAPNLNAFVERWIQSLKHEALNHFVVFGLAHFDYIVSEFVAYYLERRPHQGIGNRLIGDTEGNGPPPILALDELRCESRLDGLLKHYYRAA